jgi:hypothetical protein
LKNISPYCDFFLLLEIFYRYTLEKRSALINRGKDSRAGCHDGTKTRKLKKFIKPGCLSKKCIAIPHILNVLARFIDLYFVLIIYFAKNYLTFSVIN